MDNTSISAPHRNGQNGAPLVVAPTASPAAVRDDFSLKDLIELLGRAAQIVRANWYWGVLSAAVVGGSAACVLNKRPVEFTAQTALLAQSALDRVIGTPSDSGGDQARENNLRNHLSMMTSRRFRTRLLAAFTPQEKREIAAPYLEPGQKADDEFFHTFLPRKIFVERERGREYYTITVTHMVPKTAIMIADYMASQYLAYVQQEYKIANQQGYQILQKQADMLRADIAKVESERLDFRKKNGIISRSENQGILAERLKRLDASLAETRIKRVSLETLSQQAGGARARSEYPWDNAYLAGFANNETLRQELDKQVAHRAMLASRYGPNHPKLRDVDSQIKGIQSAIQRNFDVAVRDLAAQLAVVLETERLLKKEFDTAFESSIEIEKLASNYEILSAGVDSKKITLNELERKIGEASIFSNLPADFLQIVDPAYLIKPRVPRLVLYSGLVGCLALAAFLCTPLLVSVMDERISANVDIEQALRLPMLAAIPKLKLRIENRAHVVRDHVDSVATESFIGIAGQLELDSADHYPKVILVTSTLPEEGKSLIASNLASAYQRLEKRTVLVDLDLRRPAQHVLHGVPMDDGFIPWAKSASHVDPVSAGAAQVNTCKLPDGVDLIVAGGAISQPGHLLVGKGMEKFIGSLKEQYDVVIIDTPPAGVFQDALVLARHANVTLLVARDSVAPLVQVRKVIDDFSRANLTFRGVVLNSFSPGNANKKLAYAYAAAARGYNYGATSGGTSTRPNGTAIAARTRS